MISVRNLTKRYAARHGSGAVNAVDRVSFDVAKGDFFTLLGPSGCGKSTTLQCIAGLETPDEGEIEMDGEVVLCTRRKILVPANRRNIGMIFQSYAIWPHMTVFDNVAFPLVHGEHRVRGIDVKRRVMQTLEMVQLADYARASIAAPERRSAAARGPGPRTGARAAPAAAGRAVEQPRRQAARRDARRAAPAREVARHHHGLRHARPARSACRCRTRSR